MRAGVGSRAVPVRRFDDWRIWRSDYYARHGWYRGSWRGDWYGRWDTRWRRSWRRYPVAVAFGITPWGVNRMGYWFGYESYYNPYFVRPLVIGTTTIDYSQPLVAYPPEYDDTVILTDFDRARDAFKRERYEMALTLVNRAVARHPRDAAMHEFRGLVLFALADYRQAAQTLNPVLAIGPGWDWPTLRSQYSGIAEYTRHLRALETYVSDHKDEAHGHFLLGYHYLTMGHADAARTQLQLTVDLAPKDQVSKQLLVMLDKDARVDEPAVPPADAAAKLTIEELAGTWNAKRGSADFRLQLSTDKSFTWTYQEGSRTTKATGVFAIQNGTLALEPEAGGVMLAQVELQAKDRMRFRMIGSGAKDPGLTFSR